MRVHDILIEIGRRELAQSLGVGLTTISNAAVKNLFPASWYPTVQRLSKAKGISVPQSLFAWRRPSDATSLHGVFNDTDTSSAPGKTRQKSRSIEAME